MEDGTILSNRQYMYFVLLLKYVTVNKFPGNREVFGKKSSALKDERN